MNERQRDILEFLSNNDCWIKGGELASHFRISDRTIRNDISKLNSNSGRSLIIADKHLGYRYNKGDGLTWKRGKIKTITKDHRLLYILKTFLCRGSFNVFDMAELLNVSETTVGNDISALFKLIKELDYEKINLIRNGFTYSVEGTECYLNNLLYEIGRYLFRKFGIETVSFLFPNLDLCGIIYAVDDVLAGVNMPHKYLRNTEITLDIAVIYERDTAGHPGRNKFVDSGNNDRVFSKLIKTMEDNFKIAISRESQLYLNNKINSLFEISSYAQMNITKDDPVACFFEKVSDEIIERYGINIKENKDIFYETVNHTRTAVKRIRCGYKYFNPIRNQIYEQSIYIIDIVLYICNRLKEEFGTVFDSNEMSYLVVYTGIILAPYYIEQYDNHEINILVINMESRSVFKGLLKYINGSFTSIKIKWTEVGSYLELDRANELSHFFDFIIRYGEDFPGKIKPDITISADATFVERKLLIEKISRKVNEIKLKKFENSILKYFDRSLVFPLYASTPEKSIYFLARQAVRLGIADNGFYEAVMRREEFMPTSQPSGVALPHALEFEAKKTLFLIGILNEPIKWGNNKVKIILLLCSTLRDEAMLPLITNFLSKIFYLDKIRNKILRINTYDEIKMLLQNSYMNNEAGGV
jgi:lichenan operon transcriptional antiterminator